MRVSVAGATDAIGKRLVPQLIEAGHQAPGGSSPRASAAGRTCGRVVSVAPRTPRPDASSAGGLRFASWREGFTSGLSRAAGEAHHRAAF